MRALVHLAHCSHGCAEPARARLLERRSDPGIPRGPCRPGHFFPYPGRAPGGRPYLGGAGGGGARRCGPGRRGKSVAEGWQGLRAVAGGGGRWPRDVASTAEPGRAVLWCHASGAGKPISAPTPAFPSRFPLPRARTQIRPTRQLMLLQGVRGGPSVGDACACSGAPGVGLLESGARESDKPGFACHHVLLI